MNRNAPCPCGSGKRFKHCCGANGQASVPTRSLALAAHRTGSLRHAESLYRRALDENPDDVDARHMLGVVLLERMRYRDALDILLDAAERTDWAVPEVRHNLGLAIAKLLAREANDRQTELVPEFLAWERSHSQAQTGDCPLVTVVVRAHDHAQRVAQAISSVVAQSYSNIELVVIDDGSRDRTVEVVRECLSGVSIPTRFVARTSQGAPATYNEGASLARGKFVAFLDGDDDYAPGRVAALVDGIARTGVLWGYSLVSGVSADRESAGAGNAPPAAGTGQLQASLPGSTTNSFDLLQSNVAVTAGNLFVERDFFRSVGGFRDLPVQYEWDFCLRAAGLAEPRVVRRPLYFHRGGGDGTIPEARRRNAEEADRTLSAFIATALSGAEPCTNPLAPQWPGNRALLLTRVLAAGRGTIVPVPTMRRLAEDLRASHSPAPSAAGPAVTAPGLRKTAVVVLGMHRSGSSALARVLNLCGAYLPPQVLPPSATQNPAGYWEPEAIVDLNDRVLRQLGGAWNRVDFQLPDNTAIAEEFDSDARALLASEYGNEPTILLKDPRMCVLAPLWHRALTGAGYRPVYVVPVRDPLEVAQSLHARGDMSVPEGLALWLNYMKRGTEFLDSVPDVMYVRYTDLLDDWRGVVGRIAERLGVALDAVGRADEVDRFLVPGLRRQRSDDAALDALPSHPANAEIRTLHRACLARCDQDASPRAMQPRTPARERAAATAPGLRQTAVVVLGMHRSGSSALARVLNLCGAYLPPNLRRAKLRMNPKGSWEPEAVVNLDNRVLRQLGGAWDHVDFRLPDNTAITDEFDSDARALLASEYGNEPTILLKDPRMCVLAPLWHRALTGAGYRPVYVVPVRDPLEVAQSLHARGDMSVPEGLALWLNYMKRGTEFLDSVPDVMYVRYTDLLDDWRGVVGRIAERLGVALDAVGRADEVDRFLVPGLRRQRSDDAALDALPSHPASAEIRALYGTILARCDEDATIAPTSRAPDRRPADSLEGRPSASGATATFVLCIENNAIRDQALLLCESIRQFGGRYRNARILAFSPRAGLAVDRDTRGALADLGVEYVDEPLNTTCTEYGSANRVYAGAWAEQHSDSDFMVVLDSDTVYLDEPELPTDADVAVRPVDAKGSASRGPGDPFEDYWVALAAMGGIPIDRLPYIHATIDGERIRASYNGGLIVARRDKGIFTRTAELFTASVKAGLRPYRGSGMDVYASTGPVGQAGSEYWGSNQAVLAIAIWAATDRVVHYPACYNVPLHLVASKGRDRPRMAGPSRRFTSTITSCSRRTCRKSRCRSWRSSACPRIG